MTSLLEALPAIKENPATADAYSPRTNQFFEYALIMAAREGGMDDDQSGLTPRQSAFLWLQEKEAFFGGAAGGGKSQALLLGALQYVDIAGYAALLVRRSFPQLSQPGGLIDVSKRLLTGSQATWKEAEHTWTFPSGARIVFGHLDSENDKYKYQGAEFQFIGADELTQFSETQYTYLASRLRRRSGSTIPLRLRAASNPGGEGHQWVKSRYVDPATRAGTFIPSRMEDNTYLDVDAYREQLSVLDTITRRKLEEGDWEVTEGQFFNEWDPKLHVCTPFSIPKHWFWRAIAVDWGIRAPWAVQFWVRDEDSYRSQHWQRWYCYRELYAQGIRADDQAATIHSLVREDEEAPHTMPLRWMMLGDPAMWNRESDGDSVARTYLSQGVRLEPANNDRIQGWQVARSYLALLPDQKPGLLWFRTCGQSIHSIPSLVYDVRRTEDLDTNTDDHLADCMRYLVMALHKERGTKRPTQMNVIGFKPPRSRAAHG